MFDGSTRWASAIGAALLLVLPSSADADVAAFLDRRIAAVRFSIEGRPAVERGLTAVVETRVGESLSMRNVRESVAHLASLGRFENVVVHAEAEGEGVNLSYELTPVHPIESVSFMGLPEGAGLGQGRLRADLEDRFGASPPPETAAAMAQFVGEQLRVRGYLSAHATPQLEMRHAPDFTALTLRIEPGTRARIRNLEVDEAPGVPPGALLDHVGLAAGDPYEPDELSARIEAYLADRREAGHYEARVTLEARFEDGDRLVDLSLAVTDGPRIRVRVDGDPLPSDDIEALIPVERERAADQDLLEDSTIRIEESLRRMGYRDAAAPYRVEEVAGERFITFVVRRGSLYRVAGLEVEGNLSVPIEELRPLLQLRQGLPFDAALLDADVSAVEDLYRERGFASVVVRAGADPAGVGGAPGEVAVPVRLIVTENVQTLVGSVRVEGARTVPAAEVLAAAGLQPQQPFVLGRMSEAQESIEQYLRTRGYERATVTVAPDVSGDGSRADVVFVVSEGPQLRVDDVLIVGNTRTRAETIAREVTLASGDPLDATAILETQRRLAALGLFRRVRVSTLVHDDDTTRDLLVSVEEAPATTLGYGGGIEVGQQTRTEPGGTAGQRLEVNPRAFFEIGRRNLFGKNRSISLFTRVSLRSDDPASSSEDDPREGSRFGFVEYRVLGTFREPRVFNSLADAFLTGTAEQQTRPSFNFARRAFSAEVARALGPALALSGNYQIERTELFDERFTEDARLIDRLFPQVRLSSFSTSAVRDGRDDQLNPTRGHYASINLQLAARNIGSEVGFLRSFVTGQWFRRLPGGLGAVLATSARLGLANGFAREVARVGTDGTPVSGPDGAPLVDVVEDLPASERFFAGGDTTVRGFALDQLGTSATLDEDGFPLGGNAVTILNAELRLPVFGGFGLVGFVDAGNVFARTVDFSLGDLRGAVGFGVRYASPIGPIRVDLGFKTDRRTLSSGRDERLTALHISLGQAF